MPSFSLTKEERLSSKKDISQLISKGKSFVSYPLRVVYLPKEKKDKNTSILISVGKKKFKNAVDRNRVKRLIRSSYRQQKNKLEESEFAFNILFIYLSSSIYNYQKIDKSIEQSLNIIIKFAKTAD